MIYRGNIIYEETGLYAEPTYSATIPYSGAGVFIADGVKFKAFSDSTTMVFGEGLIHKGHTVLCPASTCMVLSGYYSGSVDIPEKIVYRSSEYAVTTIEEKAFALSRDLTSVSLPSSLTYMGWGAFFGCESLESVVIPGSVGIIPDYSFWGCKSLKSVILTSGMNSVGPCAFGLCDSLSSVILPEGLKTIGAKAFVDCKNLTYIAIPEGVDSIAVASFAGCVSLSKVILPQSLRVIECGAFSDDDSLTDVINLSSKPQMIDDNPYYNTFPSRFHATLHVPEGCAEAYRSAEIWRDFANIVEDAATSVNQVAADDGHSGDTPWFDMSGRRVDSPSSGIYIRGGHKVLLGE